ncbi:putative methyltransferase PMT2 [Bienertia sinuspersici]
MGSKGNIGEAKNRSSLSIFITFGMCCFFYLLGSWQRSRFGKGDRIALQITKQTDCSILSDLNIEMHNGEQPFTKVKKFDPCPDQFIDYTPCHDQNRAMTFPRENMNYRERHCPPKEERLGCLIPAPKGYVTPFPWPKSRDYVPYANAPYKSLTVEKAVQNWIQYEGNVFRFPGGGTQFPLGADAYINDLASVIPLDNGMIRTALDTGCGLGAYLFKKNVLAMSFAPRDSHEAQVQFALERGVPAIIGVLGTIKLPYAPRSFDMAHCSRCLIPWDANGGIYMMEVDRVLRPGGYWILSGPPINWENNYRAWQRPKEELKQEQRKIEQIAELLCWEKKSQKGEIAIWRKRENCRERVSRATLMYKKMEACITPYPETSFPDAASGGEWKPFPQRLNATPFRIKSGAVPGVSSETYQHDIKLWSKHVRYYKRVNKVLDTGRYRNIIDMNAGLGSFAAALDSPKLWVMNVVPTIAEKDTLGVVYERGLIGIYHDWCEAFSTYPRTYDLIHAYGIFSLYKNKPEGAVILRDEVEVLMQVKRLAAGMRWTTKMVDHEDGPLFTEKVLFTVKQYWVAGENNSTTPL